MVLIAKTWVQDDNHAVATLGGLIVQVWRGQRTYANWREESTPIFNYVDHNTRQGYCVLIVIEEGADMPTPQERQAANILAKERQARVIGSAVVVAGTGVRNTMVRSMVTAVNMFSRNSMRAFNSTDEALTWLAQLARERALEFDGVAAQGLVRSLRR